MCLSTLSEVRISCMWWSLRLAASSAFRSSACYSSWGEVLSGSDSIVTIFNSHFASSFFCTYLMLNLSYLLPSICDIVWNNRIYVSLKYLNLWMGLLFCTLKYQLSYRFNQKLQIYCCNVQCFEWEHFDWLIFNRTIHYFDSWPLLWLRFHCNVTIKCVLFCYFVSHCFNTPFVSSIPLLQHSNYIQRSTQKGNSKENCEKWSERDKSVIMK